MNNETKKVDVLEVLDDAARQYELQREDAERLGQPGTAAVFDQAVQEARNAREAVAELIAAAKDEARRSQATSFPLKISLSGELGISVAEIDAWMLHANRRFTAAIARIGASA